jgi:hypothetical protein
MGVTAAFLPDISVQILAKHKLLKKKRMSLNLIQVAEEAKAIFNEYAKIHHDKGNEEKRDRNINISDKLRDAIRQEKDNISIEENLLRQAADELQYLRNRNELLEVKLQMFNDCLTMVKSGINHNGYGELCAANRADTVGYIRKVLADKQANRVTLADKQANRVTKETVEDFIKK